MKHLGSTLTLLAATRLDRAWSVYQDAQRAMAQHLPDADPGLQRAQDELEEAANAIVQLIQFGLHADRPAQA